MKSQYSFWRPKISVFLCVYSTRFVKSSERAYARSCLQQKSIILRCWYYPQKFDFIFQFTYIHHGCLSISIMLKSARWQWKENEQTTMSRQTPSYGNRKKKNMIHHRRLISSSRWLVAANVKLLNWFILYVYDGGRYFNIVARFHCSIPGRLPPPPSALCCRCGKIRQQWHKPATRN